MPDADENPWRKLPKGKPFVLPGDKAAIRRFNKHPKRQKQHRVRLNLLPEPFVGSKDAPVLLLSNNPGYGKQAKKRKTPAFRKLMRMNLRHTLKKFPFVYLHPDIESLGLKWWRNKLRPLIKECSEEAVAGSVLNVAYFPYASERFKHGKLALDSQQYSFQLVREAMERNAVIVCLRERKRWFKAVAGLETYARRYEVSNTQNPTISRNNFKDPKAFDAIVSVIEGTR